MGPKAAGSSPHPIDAHVGSRLRLRRKEVGISQELLAGKLNLTFQQVQKYERGSNRISASKLAECAAALDVPIAYFFEGVVEKTGADTEASRLLSAYFSIAPEIRQRLLALVEAMSARPS